MMAKASKGDTHATQEGAAIQESMKVLGAVVRQLQNLAGNVKSVLATLAEFEETTKPEDA